MLLGADVGNTQTHFGVFEDEELVAHWRFATEPSATADELAIKVIALLELRGIERGRLDAVIVSTVVPQLGPEYARMFERHIDNGERSYFEVGPSVRTGMPILVDNPHELGADRLVNAVAAHDRVQGACITVDFGTSTNFDVVSQAGEYLGGLIGPGVEISLEALASRTAKLPMIDLSEPGDAIGRHTRSAIRSGTVYGFAGLVDGIVRRVADELDGEPRVIATGGLAGAIVPHCETVDEVDDLLTLNGLRLIYARNR